MKSTSKIVNDFVKKGKSESCPIIDMHGHWGPVRNFYMPGAPIDIVIRTLKRCGVKRVVCAPHIGAFGDPLKSDEQIQDIVNLYPDRFLGYSFINPNLPLRLKIAIENFPKRKGFVGFKLLPDYHLHPINGSGYQTVLEYANENSLIVLVHTWGFSNFDSPLLIGEVAAKYPNIVFLMGHSGFGDWKSSVKVANKYDNIFLELTAVYAAHDFALFPYGSGPAIGGVVSCLSINGVLEYLVDNVGSDRIIFGTDLPWYSPYYILGAILYAHISDQDKHNILHRNAEKLLEKYL